MPTLELRAVSKRFGDAEAVAGVSLEVGDGELVVLLGPSGCGKSTLLRLVAGLERPDAGEIRVDGEPIDDLEPEARDVAMVFQSYALYPHLDVRGNLEFPLRLAKLGRAARAERVERTAALLGLERLLDRRPAALSGGQAQRVAMGRALVREPKLLLLDEPLSNLDARLRVELRAEIAELQRRQRVTTLYVTHDQVEAMTLGDRVAVLDRGRLRQVAPPRELYERPADRFVAGFLGSPPMNLVRAGVERRGDGWQLVLGDARVAITPPPAAVREAGGGVAGVRPEALAAAGGGSGLELEIVAVESLGHEQVVHLRSPVSVVDPATGDELAGRAPLVAARLPAGRHVRRGERLGLALDPAAVAWFAADGRTLRDGG